MTANIHGEMVYSFEQPMWHNITEPSLVQMGAEEILDARFGGGFEILLRPVTVTLNGQAVETGDLAVVRGNSPYDPQELVLAYCTSRYHPLQPREVAQCFDGNVRQPAETMAFLGNGEEMFISWKMPEFEVVKGDSVQLFGIVRGGFDTKTSYRLFTSAVRPVCWNTITLAQGWADKNTDGEGRGNVWKGKAVSTELLKNLGYWMEHVQSRAEREAAMVENLFKNLAHTPIKQDVEAHEILYYAYPPVSSTSSYYPAQLVSKKDEEIAKANESQAQLRDGIYELFAGGGTAITADYWGMMNATSEYFCHVQASKKPIAESVMFGGRAKNIKRMVDVLSERMG